MLIAFRSAVPHEAAEGVAGNAQVLRRLGRRNGVKRAVLVACMAAAIALPTGSASRSSVRVATNLGLIDGPFFSSADPVAEGDIFYTEALAYLAKQLTLEHPESRARIFDISESYECIAGGRGSGPVTPVGEILKADYVLKATVRCKSNCRDLDPEMLVQLSLLRADTGVPVWRKPKERTALRSRLSEQAANLVCDLFSSKELDGKIQCGNDAVLAEFKRYPFVHHVEIAKSRVHRLAGRRFGRPNEESKLREAQTHLEYAASQRGYDEDGKGNAQSTFELLEQSAVTFRLSNLDGGQAFADLARQSLSDDRCAQGKTFPELLVWCAVARLPLVPNGDCEKFADAAIDAAPDWGTPHFTRGFARYYSRVASKSTTARTDSGEGTPETDFHRAGELNPCFIRARAYEAKLMAESSPEAGLSGFAKVLAVRDDPFTLYLKAMAFWRLHRRDEALKVLDEILAIPSFYQGDTYRLRALIEMESADPSAWTRVADSLLAALDQQQRWKELVARFRIAAADLSSQSTFAELQEWFAAELSRQSEVTRVDYALLGLIAARADDFSTALEIASGLKSLGPATGAKGSPDEITVHIALACIYQRSQRGKVAEALASYNQRLAAATEIGK